MGTEHWQSQDEWKQFYSSATQHLASIDERVSFFKVVTFFMLVVASLLQVMILAASGGPTLSGGWHVVNTCIVFFAALGALSAVAWLMLRLKWRRTRKAYLFIANHELRKLPERHLPDAGSISWHEMKLPGQALPDRIRSFPLPNAQRHWLEIAGGVFDAPMTIGPHGPLRVVASVEEARESIQEDLDLAARMGNPYLSTS